MFPKNFAAKFFNFWVGKLILGFFFSWPASAQAQGRICVLAMFPQESSEAHMVRNVFQFYHLADLYLPAQMTDIQKCFQEDQYEEIIWVGHGSSLNDGISDYSAPSLRRLDGSKISLTQTYFQRRLSAVAQRSTLKKFRLNLCNPNFENQEKAPNTEFRPGDRSTIDGFVRQLRYQGVQIDLAPEVKWASTYLSWFGGKDRVSSLRYQWLSQSLNRDIFTSWSTEGNGWCESDRWPHCDRQKASYAYPTTMTRGSPRVIVP